MESRDMIRMANQIADFFKGYDRNSATTEMADHINRFWEPRMRIALLSYIEKGGEGMHPLVIESAHLDRRPKEFRPYERDTKPGPTDSTSRDLEKAAAGYAPSEDH